VNNLIFVCNARSDIQSIKKTFLVLINAMKVNIFF
jgi:hypothetical protein